MIASVVFINYSYWLLLYCTESLSSPSCSLTEASSARIAARILSFITISTDIKSMLPDEVLTWLLDLDLEGSVTLLVDWESSFVSLSFFIHAYRSIQIITLWVLNDAFKTCPFLPFITGSAIKLEKRFLVTFAQIKSYIRLHTLHLSLFLLSIVLRHPAQVTLLEAIIYS